MRSISYIHFGRKSLIKILSDETLTHSEKVFLVYCITKANFKYGLGKKGDDIPRGSFVVAYRVPNERVEYKRL